MSAKEIRLHGRGGQGAVMAAKMLASALSLEGKFVASFPMYGFERRGMPVIAFTRFDDEPILEKTQIYTPDLLMVIDPTLLSLKALYDGLKPGGVLILNRDKPLAERPGENLEKAGVVNATHIALCEIGRDIPNTCLLGALVKTTGWLSLDSLLNALGEYLEGSMLEKNIHIATRGYNETEVQTWDS
jgi:2-oxoacid:acceptor oxidoreductase gamma subunit (pyruvate/2-ketoisovalerate family)